MIFELAGSCSTALTTLSQSKGYPPIQKLSALSKKRKLIGPLLTFVQYVFVQPEVFIHCYFETKFS